MHFLFSFLLLNSITDKDAAHECTEIINEKWLHLISIHLCIYSILNLLTTVVNVIYFGLKLYSYKASSLKKESNEMFAH